MSQVCAEIHYLFQQLPQFEFPFNVKQIPQNGIYVLFESGEFAHATNRIVRIGTHTGKNQLRSRLEQHFLRENKDRSIFRKNIGRAILNRNKDSFLTQWEIDLTSKKARVRFAKTIDRDKLVEIERKVTEYLQAKFHFVVFRVDDKDARLQLESRIISTISLCDECRPSTNWLGLHSPKARIRESGLWLVNELYGQPLTTNDLEHLKALLS